MWRSPIDNAALHHAHLLARRFRGDYTFFQLPPLGNPDPTDIVPIWHPGQPGGRDYGITLKILSEFFSENTLALFFDVEDYGAVPGTDSTTGIQAAINAAYAAGGGTVLIKGAYNVSSPLQLTNGGVAIWGLSPTSSLTMTGSGDIIDVTATGNGNGVEIRSLRFAYNGCGRTGAAINVGQPGPCENVRISNCFFNNCPIGIDFRKCLQCAVLDCTIETPTCEGTIGIVLGGDYYQQCNVPLVDNTVIRGFNGNTSCIGIVIGECYQGHITNTGCTTLAKGVLIGAPPGVTPAQALRANFNTFTNCYIESSGHAVQFKPYGADADSQIIGMWFDGCLFRRGNDTLGTFPLVEIQTDGLPNTAVDTVLFTDCVGFNATGAGILIKGGQSIQIIGGRYSSNSQSVSDRGGISVDGPAQNVQVVGVNLTGTFPNPQTHANLPTQPFAVTLTNGAASVYLQSCDMRFNVPTGLGINTPVLVDQTCADVRIWNCLGTSWEDNNAVWGGDTTLQTGPQKVFEQALPQGIFYIGNASFLYSQRGHIHTPSAAAVIGFAMGGQAQLVVKGPFVAGDQITYNCNQTPITITVNNTTPATIVTQLAAAVMANGSLATLITATGGVDNYGNAVMNVVATDYAWGAVACTGAGSLTQSASTTSANGTVSLSGAPHIVVEIAQFTIPTGTNDIFEWAVQVIANPNSNGQPACWTWMEAGNPNTGSDTVGSSTDETIDQSIRCYMQFGSAASGNQSEQNMYAYQRLS